jgi:antitoxin (DNA-binding transcriptional repressor) of toxin-antitoxin stability system
MRAVGIKALKDKLSEYIRAAGSGETILVTDRDRVVAQITPPLKVSSDRHPVIEEGLREGWLTAASVPKDAPLPARNPIMKHADLLEELDAARDDC